MTALLEHTLDADAHEMAPLHMWESSFGKAAGQIAELVEPMLRKTAEVGAADLWNPSVQCDDTAITYENVWNIKGTSAPGAFDFSRRLAVMDQMGIDRQLIFPSFALVALPLMSENSSVRNYLRSQGDLMSHDQYVSLGQEGLTEYNDWAVNVTAMDPDRLRPVAYLSPTAALESFMEDARSLIDRGVRVLHIPHGVPPGGRSPASPDLDPFWALCVENEVVCTTHLLGEFNFMRSTEWVKAPAFAPGKTQSHEIGLEPYSFATLHLPVSNFLACMVLGGVFERHPRLRFGAIELGSSWLGPLADIFDMWATKMYASRLAPFISEKPSFYLNRNVRVTPFNVVELVQENLTAYPHLGDCYCYSTDYPHVEGGKDIKVKLFDQIAPLGEEITEKYFVSNARLLLPD